MDTFGLIGLLSSIIGIIAAVIASIQFIFKPYFKRKQQYKEIKSLVDDCFQRWKELNFTVRGGSMIKKEDFLLVNKFQSKFIKAVDEMKAFLLRNAVQNGLSGSWGKWLNINKDNDKIVFPLILALDESAGFRPRWRSSLILEKLFYKESTFIYNYLPASVKDNPKIKSALRIIEKRSTEKELKKIIKNSSLENNKKAQMVIEEFESFSKQIDIFMKSQTITMKNIFMPDNI